MDGTETERVRPLPAGLGTPVPSASGMIEPRQGAFVPPSLPSVVPTAPGKLKPNGKGAGSVKRRELERSAIQLRKAGASYEQIGQQLKVTTTEAFRAVERAVRRVTRECRTDAEDVRALELERLDTLQMHLWKQVTAQGADAQPPEIVQGAVDKILKIQDRRQKLLGIDGAPPPWREEAKREAESRIAPTLRGASMEELKQLREIVKAAKERRDNAEQASKGTGQGEGGNRAGAA